MKKIIYLFVLCIAIVLLNYSDVYSQTQISVNQMPSNFFANWYSTDGHNGWAYGITKDHFRTNNIFYNYDGFYKSRDGVYTIKISHGMETRTYWVKDIGPHYMKIIAVNGQTTGRFTLFKNNKYLPDNQSLSGGRSKTNRSANSATYDVTNPITSKTESFTDPRDGQTYKTVKIGDQIWMAENLNYVTAHSWTYDNNPSNGTIYGRLYTWGAAVNACPSGWHLPSAEEWNTMEVALGMNSSLAVCYGWRGTNEGRKMKSTNGWDNNGNGTNSSGFNALPGGYRDSDGFGYLGTYGTWWVYAQISDEYVLHQSLRSSTDDVSLNYGEDGVGRSVRCLKN